MRKVFRVVVCAVVAMSLLAGCGGAGTDKQGTTQLEKTEADSGEVKSTEAGDTKEFENKELNIAIFQGGYGDVFWNEVITMFEAAYPGVNVEMNINPKIGEIIKPQIVSGKVPDFISLNDTEKSGLTQTMVKEEMLLDITDVFDGKALGKDEILRDSIVPGMLESSHFSPYKDDKIYLAPFNYGSMGLVYNKKLFEDKGWELPKTWDDFFALGKELEKEENYLKNADGTTTKRALFTYQGLFPSYLEEILFPAIASSVGMDVIDKICNYEEGSFSNPEVIKILDMFQKISTDGMLMDGTVALNHTQAQTDMMMGKALFIVNGNWMEGEMKESPREEGFEFGMMAPPVYEADGQQYVLSSYEQFYIPKDAKNPELAKEFLRFLYTDEVTELFAKEANGVMATKQAKELAKPYLTEGVYNSYDVMDTATVMPLSWAPIPKGCKVIVNEELYNNCVTPVMNGTMTTKEWADNVEAAFKEIRESGK